MNVKFEILAYILIQIVQIIRIFPHFKLWVAVAIYTFIHVGKNQLLKTSKIQLTATYKIQR